MGTRDLRHAAGSDFRRPEAPARALVLPAGDVLGRSTICAAWMSQLKLVDPKRLTQNGFVNFVYIN